MDLESSQLWGTPAIKTVPESGFPDTPVPCLEATGTPAPAMQQRARKNSPLLIGLPGQSGFHSKKSEAQEPRLPNLETLAQILIPNFQIPFSVHDRKQGDGTFIFQESQLKQEPQSSDSQAVLFQSNLN